MANEEEQTTTVQSAVQYKKFDNEDTSEIDKTSTVTLSSGATSSTASETTVNDNQSSGVPPPVVEVPLEDTPRQNVGAGNGPHHEVVLQMNGTHPAAPGSEPQDEWMWMNLVLSVCSIFCCTVCGILATVTAILAYIDHRVKDFEASRRKRVASYGLALTALIVGVICMIIVVVLAVQYGRVKVSP